MSRRKKTGPTPSRRQQAQAKEIAAARGMTLEQARAAVRCAAGPPDHEVLVETLWALVGVRNVVIARLAAHLSDEEKAQLGWPLDRLSPQVAARVRSAAETRNQR